MTCIINIVIKIDIIFNYSNTIKNSYINSNNSLNINLYLNINVYIKSNISLITINQFLPKLLLFNKTKKTYKTYLIVQ